MITNTSQSNSVDRTKSSYPFPKSPFPVNSKSENPAPGKIFRTYISFAIQNNSRPGTENQNCHNANRTLIHVYHD